MHECFARCCAVVFDFFDRKVGVCGDPVGRVDIVDVNYDEDGIGDVVAEESVNGEV